MRRLRVTGPARRDIAKILTSSEADFGKPARDRYRRLIDQALQDLCDNAARPGVRSIDEVREGYWSYHLKWSRQGSVGRKIKQPRHLIAFYVDESDTVIVARVFHERQMLDRHLNNQSGE